MLYVIHVCIRQPHSSCEIRLDEFWCPVCGRGGSARSERPEVIDLLVAVRLDGWSDYVGPFCYLEKPAEEKWELESRKRFSHALRCA